MYSYRGDTMKKLAIISEFNPFHNGHKFLIDECKKKTDAEIFISLMSGDFVQRGEPAIIDKFTRAEVSIANGFDLVIEMPTFISLQAAEFFAYKSVEILNKIGIDYLAFGIERLRGEEFIKYAHIILKNRDKVEKITKVYLKKNYSFTKARYESICSVLGRNDFISSNNILAFEYIKAINKINPSIEVLPIPRKLANNSETTIRHKNYASSTAIRNNLSSDIYTLMPESSYLEFIKHKESYPSKNTNIIFDIFRYKFIIENSPMNNILCFEDGLDNLFKKHINTGVSYDDFLTNVTSSRHTKSRIRRLVLNYILSNSVELNYISPDFIKVLAFNKKSVEIFSSINKTMNIIMKKSDEKFLTKSDKVIYQKMIEASNLYSIIINRNLNYDLTRKVSIHNH